MIPISAAQQLVAPTTFPEKSAQYPDGSCAVAQAIKQRHGNTNNHSQVEKNWQKDNFHATCTERSLADRSIRMALTMDSHNRVANIQIVLFSSSTMPTHEARHTDIEN